MVQAAVDAALRENMTERKQAEDDLRQMSSQILAQVRSEVEEVPSLRGRMWQIYLGSLPARVRSQPPFFIFQKPLARARRVCTGLLALPENFQGKAF